MQESTLLFLSNLFDLFSYFFICVLANLPSAVNRTIWRKGCLTSLESQKNFILEWWERDENIFSSPDLLLNITSENLFFFPCYYLSILLRETNTLTADWQEICFVSFFISASLCAVEMDSWTDSLRSFRFSRSLTCTTSKSFPKWGGKKKVIPRYDSAPSNLHVRQGLGIWRLKGFGKSTAISLRFSSFRFGDISY